MTQRLPPVVKQLGVVSFLNDLASEMVYPLLPALVTTRLGGTALALGALDGVADAVAATVKAASGWLADRRGWRRPLVVGGYVLATVTRPLMGVAGAAWQVIALRGTDRFGKGVRTPARDAVIADQSPGPIRGRAFGYHRAMDHAGAVVGPVLAWALLAGLGASPARVIVASIVPGMVAVLVVAWAMGRVREEGVARREGGVGAAEWSAVGGNQNPVAGEPGARIGPAPRLVVALIVAFAFVRFPETLFLLRVQDLGVAVAAVPLLWAALHVVRSAASYPGGWLSDTLGPRRTMAFGWLVYATVCFGLATSEGPVAAALWLLAFGLVAGGTESPERAVVAAAAGPGARGRGFGLYHAALGVAALPGGLLLGAIYAARGGGPALVMSGAAAVLLGALGLSTVRGPRRGGVRPR